MRKLLFRLLFIVLIYFVYKGYLKLEEIVKIKKYNELNLSSKSKIISTLLDSIMLRSNAGLFYYRGFNKKDTNRYSVDTNIYFNSTQTKFIIYILYNFCDTKSCSSTAIKYKVENINGKLFFTSGESLVFVHSDYNLPNNKPIPFGTLSKYVQKDILPIYLKQKHWWNPFDFEINEDLFKYSFLSDKLSDSQKIERYTIDWAFGERQPR